VFQLIFASIIIIPVKIFESAAIVALEDMISPLKNKATFYSNSAINQGLE